MNEKIKQLAEQSGFIVDNNKIITIKQDSTIEFEKFAELIVRECVGILEPKSRYMGEGPEVLKDKINQIKNHFGFEK